MNCLVNCLLLVLTATALVEGISPRYWDIFPYVHWYYRYYAPRAFSHPSQYARLVDTVGKLKIDYVKEGQRVPQAKAANGAEKVCYQCQSSAQDSFVYNVAKVAKRRYYPYAPEGKRFKTVYVTQMKPSNDRQEGWGECQNSFPHQVEGLSSIKTVTCMGRCYIKVGKDKSVSRGCMSARSRMNGLHAGCYRSTSGQVTCVCDGGRCNNDDPPFTS